MFRRDVHKMSRNSTSSSFDFHALFTADRLWDFSRPKFLLLTGKSKKFITNIKKAQKAHNEVGKNTLSLDKHHLRLDILLHNWIAQICENRQEPRI